MWKLKYSGKLCNIVLCTMAALVLIGGSIVSQTKTNTVAAASPPLPINMIYYGWQDAATAQRIINAHPESLVSNSAAGPWKGNANIGQFMSAGIKYYEYLDGGYEGKVLRSIPNDLQSNLNYIDAAAKAGAYGIFLDEVSDGVYTAANYGYLQQISDKAHSLGLKVVFNTGMFTWADQLMSYGDYINSSETWSNTPLTASQSKWAGRTWLLTYGINDATTAANLTTGAWSKGISAQYATTYFSGLPYWFESYISQITPYAPTYTTPAYTTSTAAGQTSVTFNSIPSGSEVWLDYSYKGKTPLTITVATGSHHIGYYMYGYHSNVPLQGDFLAGGTSMTITGDLQLGRINNSVVTTSSQTSVNFGSNVSGVEVWLDYTYKGVAPLTLPVSAGSHHMGFYKNGKTITADFYLSGQSSLNIYGDMLTGFTSIW